MRLRTKLMVAFCVSVSIPLICLGWYGLRYTTQSLIKAELSGGLDDLRVRASQIQTVLQGSSKDK